MLQTLNFNGPRQINSKATFFRYESGSAGGADESIRVRADGADLGLYWPGDSVELPDPAALWEIVPTTPACVGVLRVGIGRVQSARLSGAVAVTNRISGACRATFGNGSTAVGAVTATQIIAPSANLAGVMIRRVSVGITGGAGSTTSEARIIAAPVAPTTTVPAISFQLCGAVANGASSAGDFRNDMNYVIPQGWGIWIVNNILGANAVATNYEMTYELL